MLVTRVLGKLYPPNKKYDDKLLFLLAVDVANHAQENLKILPSLHGLKYEHIMGNSKPGNEPKMALRWWHLYSAEKTQT